MSQTHFTTKVRCYKHLSETERGQIQAMVALKVNVAAIAQALSRMSRPSIASSRPNSVDQMDTLLKVRKVYYADSAQKKYVRARKNCGRTYKLADITPLAPDHRGLDSDKQVVPGCCCRLSPAAGNDAAPIGHNQNALYIHSHGSESSKAFGSASAGTAVGRRRRSPPIRESTRENSIDLREAFINERRGFGHWEMDTLLQDTSERICIVHYGRTHDSPGADCQASG